MAAAAFTAERRLVQLTRQRLVGGLGPLVCARAMTSKSSGPDKRSPADAAVVSLPISKPAAADRKKSKNSRGIKRV